MGNLTHRSYQILGLSPGASIEEIESSFKKIKEDLSGKEAEWHKLKEAAWAHDALVKSLSLGEDHPLKEDVQEQGGASRIFLFSVEGKINPFFIAGRALVLVLTLIWGFKYTFHSVGSNYAAESFLHNVSLPFHEAGHIIFSPFGDFLAVLGGSLMQLIIPSICVAAFLKREDTFGASTAVWWLGQNFVDLAPYINDARAQSLILLGGVTGQDVPGFHDWNNILGTVGLLKLDHFIAYMSHYSGILLLLASSAWGGYLLYLQWKHVDL